MALPSSKTSPGPSAGPVAAGYGDSTGSLRSGRSRAVVTETGMIRTPDQRVRVFVSSSLQELALERQAVRDAVTRLRLVPVMFELGARSHPPASSGQAPCDTRQCRIEGVRFAG